MRRITSLLFLVGLGFLIAGVFKQVALGNSAMLVGQAINQEGLAMTGAVNQVAAVLLGFRGFDTLLELTILFSAATAAGLALGHANPARRVDPDSGPVLRTGADLFFPLLLVVGMYIIFHGHLTPGGGFQGGVILAAAFFVPVLASPALGLRHDRVALLEGLSGAAFVIIGLLAMFDGQAFLAPLLDKGQAGQLLSAGSLPLLYLAVGLKVGAELAGLLAHIAETEAED